MRAQVSVVLRSAVELRRKPVRLASEPSTDEQNSAPM